MSHSLTSLKGIGQGTTKGVIRGDTRSLDCSSCSRMAVFTIFKGFEPFVLYGALELTHRVVVLLARCPDSYEIQMGGNATLATVCWGFRW